MHLLEIKKITFTSISVGWIDSVENALYTTKPFLQNPFNCHIVTSYNTSLAKVPISNFTRCHNTKVHSRHQGKCLVSITTVRNCDSMNPAVSQSNVVTASNCHSMNPAVSQSNVVTVSNCHSMNPAVSQSNVVTATCPGHPCWDDFIREKLLLMATPAISNNLSLICYQ